MVDKQGGRQPMIKNIDGITYNLAYNGELYNTNNVRNILLEKGYTFKSYSDTEVLVIAYIEWTENCFNYINGIYAFPIWEEENDKLFLARDPLGVKPLFYKIVQNTFIFGSQIKAILKHPLVKTEIEEEGLMEIFGLGSARSLGNGVFKGVKEVPPGYFTIFYRDNIYIKNYCKLKAEPHVEGFEETKEKVKELLVDSIERQLVGDVRLCTFLSGGLDSSAISSITRDYFIRNGKGKLNTFSIDYEGNDLYFKKSIFQPTKDSDYLGLMVDYLDINHENVV